MKSKPWIFLNLFLFLCLSNSALCASDIELPEEELAKETVLPVFEKPGMVRMRNIATEKKYEMGLNFGWLMTEPIFDTTRLGVSGYYHTSEDSAWGGIFYAHSSGLSSYAKQLKEPGIDLDFNRAPKPQMSIYADYNKKLFYGKMSVSKNSTINTHLQFVLAGGITTYENNKAYFGIAPGVGYKFYFTNHLSLRTDLRLMIHQAPTPFKSGALLVGSADPGFSVYKDRIHYTNTLDIGLNYLF